MNNTFRLPGLLLFLFICGVVTTSVAQTSRIDSIRNLYQRINEEIARSEESPESSTTFLTKLEVNKNLRPYPAVGVYKTTVKFYYTFGDREKNPYPNRLLKIIVSTDRSDQKEYSEYVFDQAAQLVFYFDKKDEVERRLYFTAERPIRFQQGERTLSLKGKQQAVAVAGILKEKAKLITLFRLSLNF